MLSTWWAHQAQPTQEGKCPVETKSPTASHSHQICNDWMILQNVLLLPSGTTEINVPSSHPLRRSVVILRRQHDHSFHFANAFTATFCSTWLDCHQLSEAEADHLLLLLLLLPSNLVSRHDYDVTHRLYTATLTLIWWCHAPFVELSCTTALSGMETV